jgi:hypothetical protein
MATTLTLEQMIGDIDTAERFGERVALISRRFKDGIVFETERTTEADFRKLNLERSLLKR